MKSIFIVGSTGSLGKEALEVIKKLGNYYKVIGITGFQNVDMMLNQIKDFDPRYIGMRENYLETIRKEFPGKYIFDVEKDLEKVVLDAGADLTLFLSSDITALKSIDLLLSYKKYLAIANKESIIAGGEIIFSQDRQKYIIPVDSELSALFQCLIGEKKNAVKRFIVTASGGPFWERDIATFDKITPSDALRHPNWRMGKKITVDSATLINKAFEVIESHFFFGIDYKKIEVIVHRESIIHSMIEFVDGNMKALMSTPLMYFPLEYAITCPERAINSFPESRLDLEKVGKLTFYPLNNDKFPGFLTASEYGKRGGNFLPLLIAIDKVLVDAFLKEMISFSDIPRLLEKGLSQFTYKKVDSVPDIVETYNEGILLGKEMIKRSVK
ncbi:MAG: 1-deoxy-D-xylulose-5-phosphate reductoisomerase [Caldisericaceae bacterium]|nr:1-deoxy-D-xylulose-5-phosphate reductoisomerase [Caldisericaceae bacterium]